MATSKSPVGGFAGWALTALQRGRQKAAERELTLVETLSLGGRKQVSLVTCGGQKFLVGCGADSVTSIVAVTEAAQASASKSALWEAGL